MTRIRLNISDDVKPFKTISEQLDLLEARGLIIPDRNSAARGAKTLSSTPWQRDMLPR